MRLARAWVGDPNLVSGHSETMEYANGILMLHGDKKRKQAVEHYRKATEVDPRYSPAARALHDHDAVGGDFLHRHVALVLRELRVDLVLDQPAHAAARERLESAGGLGLRLLRK